jgi:hypothetical protein
MRRYLSISLLLLGVLSARAQTPVTGNTQEFATCAAGSCTATLANPSTAGNAYVVFVGPTTNTSQSVVSVADTNLNAYNSETSMQFNPGFSGSCSGFVCGYQTFVACNISVALHATPTFTITLNGGAGGAHTTISEIGGVLASSSCTPGGHGATTANAGTAGTQFSSGTVATAKANALIVGCATTNNGNTTVGTGYSLLGASHSFNICEQKNVTALGSYDAKFSSTVNSDQMMAQVTILYSSTQPAGGFPMVIKYRAAPYKKIPWDNRKRKLETVRT